MADDIAKINGIKTERMRLINLIKELLPKYINFNDDHEFYGTVNGKIERDF